MNPNVKKIVIVLIICAIILGLILGLVFFFKKKKSGNGGGTYPPYLTPTPAPTLPPTYAPCYSHPNSKCSICNVFCCDAGHCPLGKCRVGYKSAYCGQGGCYCVPSTTVDDEYL